MARFHKERHRTERMGWLRAAVLGANDGIVSTSSLLLGVAAAHSDRAHILIAGGAGLVAGAMSMAAGEYVSVHSQADGEEAELALERAEIALDPAAEKKELANIYMSRGLDPALAREVAEQLMAKDAEGAHARDELGLTETNTARPLQAALASAGCFAAGAALPLGISAVVPLGAFVPSVAGTALFFLGTLGALSAFAGGAKARPAAIRVTFWGALAMGLTAGVGALFGAVS